MVATPKPKPDVDNQIGGDWGDVKDWPLIGLHSIVTQDGKVLTFGTDSQGMQGGQFIYDVYDPETGEHTTLENTTPTDIFCSAAMIIPGTNKILIGGGDGRVGSAFNKGLSDVNVFNSDDLSLKASEVGDMHFARWYPTMVSLPTGQVVILGGRDQNGRGISTPEIFTPGEGWRKLDGAEDGGVGSDWWYPKAWLNNEGEIVYFASGSRKVMALDPSGSGEVRQIGELPFSVGNDASAVMYESGKILIMDNSKHMWTMDINGPEPVFKQTQSLDSDRNWADMTVMADGNILINGGTSKGNSEADANLQAAIWDPDTGKITYADAQTQSRLYHSSSVLLADGTVLSTGGGAAGSAEVNHLNAEIYKPPYLYNEDGSLADRPVITGAPEELVPGESFTISVDDASSIGKLTFVKNGAATHSFNMGTKIIELEHKVNADNTITVTLPENANEVTAGSWMLFAWDNEGVPAKAAIIAVNPTELQYDGIGDLTAEYFTIDAATKSLDQIDFDGEAVHTERVSEIDENSGGSFYRGGTGDHFAARYSGEFETSATGEYTFNLKSDDGSRLFIDGKQVIDNDGLHGTVEKTATVSLEAGLHKVELIYFEKSGGAVVDLDWSGPGFTRKQMAFDGLEENLIVDGSFEVGPIGSGEVSSSWVATGPGGRYTDANRATQDSGFYALGGFSGENGKATLSQTVDTEIGREYTFSFFASNVHGANENLKLLVEILDGADSINNQTYGPDELDNTGNRQSTTFTATGDKTTFRFNDKTVGGRDIDINIDGVVLTAGELVDPPVDDKVISGTAGDDYLVGTDGDDIFKAGDGVDVIHTGAGDDIVDGEGGDYNQVDLPGASTDYTFTQNDDGTVSGAHAEYGTKTLSNIDGVWFIGDQKWSAIDDLLPEVEVVGKSITGTAGDDYLVGTDGDDVIKGGDGVDVIFAGAGDDIVDGEGGDYNQVDLLGASTDYTFTKNDDGTVTAVHAEHGAKTLSNIDGAWFIGDQKWSSVDDLLPEVEVVGKTITGTAGDDYLVGTDGDDDIKGGEGLDVIFAGAGIDSIDGEGGDYNQVDLLGNSTDYTFTQNDDGTISAVHAEFGTKTLSNIDGAWFIGDQKWSSVDDLLPEVEVVGKTITGTAGDDYLVGTAGDDIFLGGEGNDVFSGGKGDDIYDGQGGDYNQVDFQGSSADYTFTKNTDGTITAEHAEFGKDILKEIDGVWFSGDEVWQSVDDIVA